MALGGSWSQYPPPAVLSGKARIRSDKGSASTKNKAETTAASESSGQTRSLVISLILKCEESNKVVNRETEVLTVKVL